MRKSIFSHRASYCPDVTTLLSFVAGVVIFLAVLHTVFLLAWVCFVPMFLALEKRSVRQAVRTGALTGAVIAACGFSWMIPAAKTFTGNSSWYGIAVFMICTLIFAVYWAGLTGIFVWIRAGIAEETGVMAEQGRMCVTGSHVGGELRQTAWAAKMIPVKEALLAGCLWVSAETGLQYVASGMPWFLFHTGNALSANLYAIQPVSWTGIHGATFIVVFVNYLLAHGLPFSRRGIKFLWPLLAIGLYMGWGWVLLARFGAVQGRQDAATQQKPDQEGHGASFSLSILSENISPEIQWDEVNGSRLVQRLLDLERQAVALRPQMILWSESAIPWTYKPDDDLVRELVRVAGTAKITQVLGMNTEIPADPAMRNTVFNSAYCILPGGRVSGSYDKRVLLTLVEKPIAGWIIPLYSSNGFSVRPGTRDLPLATPYGNAGVLICNESAVPAAAADMVRHGAQFLLNMSNDGWFRDTYIVSQHFYNARLRAVETRKDIAINSNDGMSGLISASGRIEQVRSDDTPVISTVSVRPNDWQTMAVRYPLLPVYICLLFVALCALPSFRNTLSALFAFRHRLLYFKPDK